MMMKVAMLFLILRYAFGFSAVRSSPRCMTTALADTAHNVVYRSTIDNIARVLKDTENNLQELERLAIKLKNLEQRDPHVGDTSDEDLKKTVAEAKAAVDTFGPDSPEAQSAWEDVDANNISHPSYRYSEQAVMHRHSYDTIVDTALLQDCIKSVENLLALNHFVQIEHDRLHKKELSP